MRKGQGLRVIGGALRGRRLVTAAGLLVRPTSDRVREALFDILGDKTRGARFLDLFAGSGAVGIEALSRGADEVVLIEDGREALRALEKNLEELGLASRAKLVRASWPGALELAGGRPRSEPAARRPRERTRPGAGPRERAGTSLELARRRSVRFSIVFSDPPYRDAPYLEILESLSEPGLLEADAVVVVEHQARVVPPQGFGQLRLHRTVSYGRAALAFYHQER